MDKEREIERVFDILDKHITLEHKAFTDNIVGEWDAAKAVVEAGYHKTEDIDKDAVKDLLRKIWKQSCDGEIDLMLLQFAEKYNVSLNG